nr:hypothetical protein Iba_chr06bCG15900 [Ipomoea batatas]
MQVRLRGTMQVQLWGTMQVRLWGNRASPTLGNHASPTMGNRASPTFEKRASSAFEDLLMPSSIIVGFFIFFVASQERPKLLYRLRNFFAGRGRQKVVVVEEHGDVGGRSVNQPLKVDDQGSRRRWLKLVERWSRRSFITVKNSVSESGYSGGWLVASAALASLLLCRRF